MRRVRAQGVTLMAEARPGTGRLRRSAITLSVGCAIALLVASSIAATPVAPVSPNGLIAFPGVGEERLDQVFSIDVATGDQRSLTPVESRAGPLAAVSPDGATI